MRFSLVILAALAATLCIEQPAMANWCAQYNYGGGATNCGFRTHQQCLAAVRIEQLARRAGIVSLPAPIDAEFKVVSEIP
jgi:hypothetical protein